MFNPVAKQSAYILNELKEDNVLYCLDEAQFQVDKLELFGENERDDFQRIEFNMQPCVEDLENGICVNKTLEGLIDYLSPANLMIYLNVESFNPRSYEHENKIIKESMVINQ